MSLLYMLKITLYIWKWNYLTGDKFYQKSRECDKVTERTVIYGKWKEQRPGMLQLLRLPIGAQWLYDVFLEI
jgi:hypothetical protein